MTYDVKGWEKPGAISSLLQLCGMSIIILCIIMVMQPFLIIFLVRFGWDDIIQTTIAATFDQTEDENKLVEMLYESVSVVLGMHLLLLFPTPLLLIFCFLHSRGRR